MGSGHSVIPGSQKREDMSCCDIEYKHGKTWDTLVPRDDHSLTSVFRLCLFMGDSCNNMQNDEEQSPVAVRLPKNWLFLLKQLKNWVTKKFPGFNAAKINSPIYQEPIYRSPGAGQQMGNAHYSIVFQIENHDAFYQGANRFQMLPWDAHEPPHKKVTRGGSWYIVSMEVFKDEMDSGGRCPDNPEVHLKVILHIANRRMTQTPPDFGPFDPYCQTETYTYNDVLTPCVLDYHVDSTLSPEELSQLVRIQKYLLLNEQPTDPIPNSYLNFSNPVSSIIPNTPWFNNEAIHGEHQDLYGNGNSKKCPPYTNINAEYTRTLGPGPPEFNHGAINVARRNLNICRNPTTFLHSSYYKPDFNSNFSNPVSSVIPNPHLFKNESIHEDHQDLNANGNSKKCPLSTNIKAGNSAAPGISAICILLLLSPPVAANPVSQNHQVGIEILQNSDNLNCTLKIDNQYALCYGHCDQNQKHHQNISDELVEKWLENICKWQKRAMEANQMSLMGKHSLSSGTLQLNLIWDVDKGFNLTDVIIQPIFNGKQLTDEVINNLPMSFTDFRNSDLHSRLYTEEIKDNIKKLWEILEEKLFPVLKNDDLPESWTIPLAIFVVCFIGAIAIVPNLKCSGKETCKKLYETCLTYRRAGQNEAEAEGDPNVMEVLKSDSHVIEYV